MKPRSTSGSRFVWKRLREFYGERFARQFGVEAPDAWLEVMGPYSLGELRTALSRVRQHHPTHPPTLGEFEAQLRALAPVPVGPGAPSSPEALRAFERAHLERIARILRTTPDALAAQWSSQAEQHRRAGS